MKLSVVTTLYKSSAYVNEFYERMTKVIQQLEIEEYELIFVDDGSPDDSLEKVTLLHNHDSRVKVIELSRNFGHHKAIMTGLVHTEGDLVFLIDSDLEEAPELLLTLWEEKVKNIDYDIIFAVQGKRKGSWFEKISGSIFYYILDFLIDDIKYPTDTMTARLMSRKYVKEVIKHKEATYDLWSIFEYTGFKSKSVICQKGYKKETSYTFFKKLDLALHIIVSTSIKPLKLIFFLGLVISALSLINLIYVIVNSFITDITPGWTSVISLLSLLIGLTIFSLGIIGIYISIIFQETKKRPIVVKNLIGIK